MKEYEAKKEILRLFYGDEGEYLSGEDISNKLGFSRAGVWKYINKLREAGYVIDAVPHLGYRLKSAPDKLYGYDISSGIRSGIFCQEPIFHIETTSSTNEKAYELAEKGAPEGAIVIAEGQTGGKGRMGRKWVSPKKGAEPSTLRTTLGCMIGVFNEKTWRQCWPTSSRGDRLPLGLA